MPCGYTPGGNEYAEEDESRLRTALNKATRAACELTEVLRGIGSSDYNSPNYFIKELTKETRTWIKKHDEMDKQRIAKKKEEKTKKQLKQKALSKLSKKERKILGV